MQKIDKSSIKYQFYWLINKSKLGFTDFILASTVYNPAHSEFRHEFVLAESKSLYFPPGIYVPRASYLY